jgi:hypothetical protein|tara:strand:- start:211 stop:438 length:228 start_codon:yes stop_codon:yes gene_type:complete
MPKKTIYDLTTNKIVVRDLTSDEEKIRDKEIVEMDKISSIEAKIKETKAKNKSSAITKLKDLGLSDDEITSLIGE